MRADECTEFLKQGYPPLLVSYWKWVDVVEGKDIGYTFSITNCALCRTYISECESCQLGKNPKLSCGYRGSPFSLVEWHYELQHEAQFKNMAIIMAMTLRALCKVNGIDTGD